MEIVLAVLSLLLPVVLWYYRSDDARHYFGLGKGSTAPKKEPSPVSALAPADLPLDEGSIFAFIRGEPLVRKLDERIARDSGLELDLNGALSRPVLEKALYLGIHTTAELLSLLEKTQEEAIRLSQYHVAEGPMSRGYSLSFALDYKAALLGKEECFAYFESLEHSGADRGFVEGLVQYARQIRGADVDPALLKVLVRVNRKKLLTCEPGESRQAFGKTVQALRELRARDLIRFEDSQMLSDGSSGFREYVAVGPCEVTFSGTRLLEDAGFIE